MYFLTTLAKKSIPLNSNSDKIRINIQSLPDLPGIYQFLDQANNIIYIGKAKNLKKRVSSYFTKKHDNAKLRIMLGKIYDINHIIVDSESDALLLENNLIKKYQPRYNVMLKDDKTYPWICIKNERFPRIFKTRNPVKDGSFYFGPYASGMMAITILDLIRQLYPLRTCNFNLSEENIKNKKFKVCLQFHIGNCLGPCVNLQSEDNYNLSIANITEILKGHLQSVLKYLKQKMTGYAKSQNFEEAHKIKGKIEIIENYKSKSTIVNPSINNIDVFAITEDEISAYVNFLKVVNGSVIQAHNIEIRKKLDEDIKDLLSFAITEIRQRFNSSSKEILLPFHLNYNFPGLKVIVPVKGDKKHLSDLSFRNTLYFKKECTQQRDALAGKKSSTRKLEIIKNDLRLSELPYNIECFDNSNIQGSNPVASCVVFKNLKPSKKDYRKFNIKTVTGANDFASMEEIVFRRYKRMTEENQNLPQLIIIDGGKGQLNSALNALKNLNLEGKIAIIGIAKKLEELYYPHDPIPLYLDKNSETLRFIQQIRNEAHRFGIAFHRDKRSKEFIKSELENIHGIGPKTIEILIKKFQSVENIKKQVFIELEKIVGHSKATIINNHYNNLKSEF
ncbi:MAG: excinuclease ABC subunit UvrC [Bacteroidota bacterium]